MAGQGIPRIEARCITAEREGRELFRDVSFTLGEGECLCLSGQIASGKTTLLRILAGAERPRSGEICVASGTRIAYVGYDSFHRHPEIRNRYYQARYNSLETAASPLLCELFPQHVSRQQIQAALRRVNGAGLDEKSAIGISNGEVRKFLIARALLSEPNVLLLDNAYVGLDTLGRAALDALLLSLSEFGVSIVITDTHGTSCTQFRRAVLEGGLLQEFKPSTGPPAESRLPAQSGTDQSAPLLFECEDVDVHFGNHAVLKNFSWTVRRGERWALLGPNGSGKSTVLSLLLADNPQAYREKVSVFGRRRGTGETIWSLKHRIGYVSPELHLYFPAQRTAYEVITSGFSDGVEPKSTLTPDEEAAAEEIRALLALEELRNRRFGTLSTGEQRLVILARGLVKRAELLVLDEPFQGLDEGTIRGVQRYLAERLREEDTLILVTHYLGEIPQYVDRVKSLTLG